MQRERLEKISSRSLFSLRNTGKNKIENEHEREFKRKNEYLRGMDAVNQKIRNSLLTGRDPCAIKIRRFSGEPEKPCNEMK